MKQTGRRILFLVCQTLICAQMAFAAESVSTKPNTTSPGLASADSNCDLEMVNAHCDEFFKANPGAAPFKRDCSQSTLAWAGDVFRAIDENCSEGFVRAWQEWGTQTTDKIDKISKKLDKETKQFDELGDKCENYKGGDIFQFKKEIDLIYDLGLTDSQIQKLSCTALLRLKTSMRNRGSKVQQEKDVKAAQTSGAPLLGIDSDEESKKAQKLYAAIDLWYHQNIQVPLACYNIKKQADMACHAIGSLATPDTIVGPALVMKLRKLAGVGEAAVDAKAMAAGRSAPLTDVHRISNAQEIVDRELTPTQRQAVIQAHEVGAGEAGLDGTPAAVGNYTEAQLKQKAQILKDAGFSAQERRDLIESGTVGAAPDTVAGPKFIQDLDKNGYAYLNNSQYTGPNPRGAIIRIKDADNSWRYKKDVPSFLQSDRDEFESLIKQAKDKGIRVVVRDSGDLPGTSALRTIDGQPILELGADASSYASANERMRALLKTTSPSTVAKRVEPSGVHAPPLVTADATRSPSATAARTGGALSDSSTPLGQIASQDKTFNDYLNAPGNRIAPTRYGGDERDVRLRELRRFPDDPQLPTDDQATALMSRAERSSINHLTMNSEDFNLYARSVDPQPCPQCETLKSALDKLPNYNGQVYRAADMPNTILDQYKVGSLAPNDPAFLSASRNFQVAEDFQLSPPYGRSPSYRTPVMFVYQTKTGKAIENLAISENTYQREVVLIPNTKFLVKQILTKPDGTRVIYLVEQ